jgi:hypothetical protein
VATEITIETETGTDDPLEIGTEIEITETAPEIAVLAIKIERVTETVIETERNAMTVTSLKKVGKQRPLNGLKNWRNSLR